MEYNVCMEKLQKSRPKVHCLTNPVSMADVANLLLTAGGSAIMAQDPAEVDEITSFCQATLLNTGVPDEEKIRACILAGKKANELGHPVVLDPVAAGASALRRRESARLLDGVRFTVIRGNASEIRALALGVGAGSGVDADPADLVTGAGLKQAAEIAQSLSRRTGAVVVTSGAIDIVTDGARTFAVRSGCPMMARITGSGCMLSALTGAFCGANPCRPLEATLAAVAAMGVCGERADRRRMANGTGNATFRNDLIDAVSLLTPEELEQEACYDEI